MFLVVRENDGTYRLQWYNRIETGLSWQQVCSVIKEMTADDVQRTES